MARSACGKVCLRQQCYSPPRAPPRRTRERKLKEYLSTPLLCLRAKSFACRCATLYLAGAFCTQQRTLGQAVSSDKRSRVDSFNNETADRQHP